VSYVIYPLHFETAVHFGQPGRGGRLDDVLAMALTHPPGQLDGGADDLVDPLGGGEGARRLRHAG